VFGGRCCGGGVGPAPWGRRFGSRRWLWGDDSSAERERAAGERARFTRADHMDGKKNIMDSFLKKKKIMDSFLQK